MKIYLKIIILLLIYLATIFLLLPVLISSDSDFLVFLGLCIIIVLGAALFKIPFLFINKTKTKK